MYLKDIRHLLFQLSNVPFVQVSRLSYLPLPRSLFLSFFFFFFCGSRSYGLYAAAGFVVAGGRTDGHDGPGGRIGSRWPHGRLGWWDSDLAKAQEPSGLDITRTHLILLGNPTNPPSPSFLSPLARCLDIMRFPSHMGGPSLPARHLATDLFLGSS